MESVVRPVRLRRGRAVVCAGMLCLGVQVVAAGGAADQDAPWAGAAARIEEHRKAAGKVTVLDGRGRPVEGARVAIEQQRHAFLFGCNIFKWDTLPSAELEAAYRTRFADLFNYATLPFYWPTYEPQQGAPLHEHRQRVARWCRDQGITTKGHPLAWNYRDPRWLPDDTAEVRRLQMARIEDCVGRFDGLIDRWDVVNEATHFDRERCRERAPRHTAMWRETGQVEFTQACFHHARRANPGAVLLINDYRTDPEYERLVEKLVDESGEPLYDVIGIQSHQHGGSWNNDKIWNVCERFSRFGASLHFTETTLLSGKQAWDGPSPWPSTREGEARQAREIVRFYTMLFSHPAVEAITWWDFSDHSAWKQAPAGIVRKDMSPKPAYDALLELVKRTWWTKTDGVTDDGGAATFRGFLGDYRVKVVREGKAPVTKPFTLERGGEPWVVRLD